MTYGTPTWIWSVVVDGSLLCALLQWHGFAPVPSRDATEAWPDHQRGRITAAGVTKNVAFELSTDRSTMT